MNGNSKRLTKAYRAEISVPYIHLPAKDVIDMAKFMLSDEEISKIIEQAGIDRPISKTCKLKIQDSLTVFIGSTQRELFFDEAGLRVRRFFPYDGQTTTALCRRMLSHRYKSFEDSEVLEYLEGNLYYYLKPLNMHTSLHVREILFLAKLLIKDIKAVAVLKNHVEERTWEQPDVSILVGRYENLAEIYGMKPRANGGAEFELIRMLLRGQISSLDDLQAIKYLNDRSDHAKERAHVDLWVRNWGYSNV